MELTELVQQYVRTRDGFTRRIAAVSQQLDQWTERHQQTPPTLSDIARFEGLRIERARLLSEFTDAEERFVMAALERLGASHRQE